jgi:hypothetical protein
MKRFSIRAVSSVNLTARIDNGVPLVILAIDKPLLFLDRKVDFNVYGIETR